MTRQRNLNHAGYLVSTLIALGAAAIALGHLIAGLVAVWLGVVSAAVAIGRWGR